MLFQLLPGFKLAALLFLQQLSGVPEGILEEAGSLFLLPFVALANAFTSAKPGYSFSDLLPQRFQTLFLCMGRLPPVLAELPAPLYQLEDFLFPPSLLSQGGPLSGDNFTKRVLAGLVYDVPSQVKLRFCPSTQRSL